MNLTVAMETQAPKVDPNEDVGPVVIRFGIAMIVIPVVSVALRFWSRALGLGTKSSDGRRFWWDDWAVLAVVVSSLVYTDAKLCS